MATSKITRVEVLKDHAGNRTGKVGILFEIPKRGLWRFSHESPPVFVAPDGTVGRMTPAEDHPDHVAAPIAVGAPSGYWFIWNAKGDGIDLLEHQVARWGYKIPVVNVMHGQEWAGAEPDRVTTKSPGSSADFNLINAFTGTIFIGVDQEGSPNPDGEGRQTLSGVSLGMPVTVLQKTIVTALGVWDDKHGDGLDNDLFVRLYDDSDGSLLASVTVPAGSGATIIDSHRYVDLSAPLVLEAGKKIQIVVFYPSGNGETNGNGGRPGDQKEPYPIFNDGGGVLQNVGDSKFAGGDAYPTTADFGGPENRYHAGSFLYQAFSDDLYATLLAESAASKPSDPSAAPGFSTDPTWDPQETPGTPLSGATDDAAGFTKAGQRAPGMPQAYVPQAPSRNTYAEAPSDERPALPFSQPEIASEDDDGNLLEAQTVPELAIFATPDSKQVAPDIPRVDEALGLAGAGTDVPRPGGRGGTPTKVPNQGSRTASLDPVPLVDYDGRVEGDALVSAPSTVASADAELICLLEPRVVPQGQFSAACLLVKNRHHAATLSNVGLYVEVLFKDGTRSLIVNTPRNVNIDPGETAQASFHLEVANRPVGQATVTAAVISNDGQPMASVSKDIVIAPEAYDPWAMGASGPTQFTDDDRVPNEVKQLVGGKSPYRAAVSGCFYQHGQPFYFVVKAEAGQISASVLLNGLAAKAGMTVRVRAGRMSGQTMDMTSFVESTRPLKIQNVSVLPGTHAAAVGFSAIGGQAVEIGEEFWISVEPTAPIHDPQYNFGLHLSGAYLSQVDATGAVRGSDGQLDGELILPWRSGVIALVNRRTTAAILLLAQDGAVDVRDRAWPVGTTLVVEPGDTIEVRHGGAYNNFAEVYTTFVPDQESA